MPRVLFVNIPSITLFQPKVYQELGWGAALVAGALEHHDFTVSYYDLNVALAKMRGEEYLSEWEEKVLTDIDALEMEIRAPGRGGSMKNLQRWSEAFLHKIDLSKKYDFIAFALDQKGYETFTCRAVLNFAVLFGMRLRQIISAPIIAGGKDVLSEVGKKYLADLIAKIPDLPIQTFFRRNAHQIFPQELVKYFNGNGKLRDQERFIDDNSTFKSSNVLPKYSIENLDDLFVSARELFPEDLLSRYPILKDQPKLTIVPFRHSMGCPYRCNFCSSGRERFIRIHEVEDILHLLQELKNQGFVNYRWYNDNLNLGPIFPVLLADRLLEANLGIFFSDSANMIHTSVPLFKKLRQAGLVKLWFGAETVSPKILKLINKSATMEDFYRTLQCGKEAGIWNSLNVILSFPHETREDFYLMYNFLRDRGDLYDSVHINTFRLLSNTGYYLEPEKHGIRLFLASDNGRVSGFDEIGGMAWRDRVEEANWRREKIKEVSPTHKRLFMQNDYVYYFLLRAGFSKAAAKKFMLEMYEYYEQHHETEYLSSVLDRTIEEERRVWLGTHIGHRLVSSVKDDVYIV